MKKIFTTAIAAMLATGITAQMHDAMKFVGPSLSKVQTMEINNESDTVRFVMTGMSAGDITLPAMKGMGTIPSFTIKDAHFSIDAQHKITFDEQTFAATVTADGAEKTITGTSLSGSYDMAAHSLTLTAVFKYGSMPFPMTYSITSYYVKPVTSDITISVGGFYTYECKDVVYNLRRYVQNDSTKLDVEVPAYRLDGTVMGDLTLGSYTVRGLLYDADAGGFYRDYKDDGLSFHFTAEQNGTKTMDGDYAFNSQKDNNILVKYNGDNVFSIVNTFQMGAMPFGIVTQFEIAGTGIAAAVRNEKTDQAVYDLQGRKVGAGTRGIVIVNGKKIFRK